jgi:hypothetical protein
VFSGDLIDQAKEAFSAVAGEVNEEVVAIAKE